MAYVYRHIRLDNKEVFYIGIGSDSTYKRANELYSGRNKFWKNVFNKSEIKIEIIFDGITWEDACLKEKELISNYGRKDLNKGTLCNLTDGGDGSINVIVSEETRRKISIAGKGRVMNDSLKEKLRLSKLGKHRTEETKNKLRKYSGIKSSGYQPVASYITGEVFATITDAAKHINRDRSLLMNTINGKYKTKDQSLLQFKKISREEYFKRIAQFENN